MLDNPENIVLKKNSYTYGDTIKKLIAEKRSEEQARNEVAKKIRKMRKDPVQRDILMEQRKKNNELQEQTLKDRLTNLYNRRAFDHDLHKSFKFAGRYKKPLTLLMVDVDHFKDYNDEFGHLEGDNALKSLAKIITETIRETDSAYRYGGEEVAVLLPETDHIEAINLGERLRKSVYDSESFKKKVTISIGAADYPNPKHQFNIPEDLTYAADTMLYQAKKEGKNQIRSINGILPKAPKKQ